MKKLILGLLVLGVMSQSYAGTLINNKTGESVTFNADTATKSIQIDSRARNLESGTIKMENIDKSDSASGVVLYEEFRTQILGEALNGQQEDQDSAWVCIYPLVGQVICGGILAYDTVALLTFKGPEKLILSVRDNKDTKILMKAIFTDKVVTVSNKRFLRLVDLVKP